MFHYNDARCASFFCLLSSCSILSMHAMYSRLLRTVRTACSFLRFWWLVRYYYVYAFCSKISEFSICCLLIQHVVPSCPLLLSFLFNVNIIPATLSSSELAVVVPGWGWVVVQVVGGKFRYMTADVPFAIFGLLSRYHFVINVLRDSSATLWYCCDCYFVRLRVPCL